MRTAKLSDSELAARLRQRNRVNSERRRIRLAAGGKVQLLAWIPATLRSELDRVAAARGEHLSDTTTALLSLALNATTAPPGTVDTPAAYTRTATPAPSAVDATPALFGDPAPAPATPATPATTDKDTLMQEIGDLLADGHSGGAIARMLNAAGRRTFIGAEFTGPNLLRDYRAWAKKTGAVDATRNPP